MSGLHNGGLFMATRKSPAKRRKTRRAVAVVGVLAILGTALDIASGSVTLAERVLALVVKGKQVLGDTSISQSGISKGSRK
jgi:hypothetical protein